MRDEYAEKSEYENAQACISKIADLKHLIQEKKKKALEYYQITAIDDLESGYKQELERVTNAWDGKIAEFEEKYQRTEETLNERHNVEMDSLYSDLEQKLENKFKYSKEYLTLETQEQQLVRFQRFNEAIIVKKKKELQRQKDIDKWNKEKNEKIKLQAIARSNKHLNEKEAFKKKNEIELELLRKGKNEDIRKIQKKYQNKKLDLDIQQRNERIVNEKEYLTKIGRVKRLNYYSTIEGHHSRSNTNPIQHTNQNNMNEKYKQSHDYNNEEEKKPNDNDDGNDHQGNNNIEEYENENEQGEGQ